MRHESEKALNVAACPVPAPSDMPDDVPGAPTELLFDSADWFALLAEHCFMGNARVTVEGAAGSTSCALHMVKGPDAGLNSLSNWYSFRWMPIYSGDTHNGPNSDQRRAALCDAMRQLRHRSAYSVFTPVPVADGSAAQLLEALRAAGWHVRTKVQNQNCWAETGAQDFDSWWAARPGQLRSTVARKGKKGVVDISIKQHFCDADWASYLSVYADSWKEAEGHPHFLKAFARAAAARGALRLGLAQIDGQVVAAQFWTVEGGVASIHKLAQLRGESIDAFSPGTLLTHALYRHCIEQDQVHRVDFGTGADGFKSGWTDACTDLMTIEAIDLRRIKAWPHLARRAATRVAARLLRR